MGRREGEEDGRAVVLRLVEGGEGKTIGNQCFLLRGSSRKLRGPNEEGKSCGGRIFTRAGPALKRDSGV